MTAQRLTRAMPAPWDPVRLAILQRGTHVGTIKTEKPVCFITPEEREAIVESLSLSLGVEPHLCENCGATKPLSWFKALGLTSCCPDRRMVPAMAVLRERADLRRYAPEVGHVQLRFGPTMTAFTENRSKEGVSARVGASSSGKGLRLFLEFTKPLSASIYGKRANVRPGVGDARGSLLVTFGEIGAFKVCSKVGRTGLILRVPSWVPNAGTRPSAACAFEWRAAKTEMLVTLPQAWTLTAQQQVAA